MEDEIRVVTDERTGGAQMDDAPRGGRHIAKEMHVGHHIMAEPMFVLCRFGEVDFVETTSHLVECLL